VRPQIRVRVEKAALSADGRTGSVGEEGSTEAAQAAPHASGTTDHSPHLQSKHPPIHQSDPSDFVRITIEDNGIGIPAPAQSRLFGMFQRLTADYEGTGIGLAIVRKVTERMGGRVGAESNPGKGSRFWVELRTANGHAHPASHAST
jgi:signal transduction histidine kinase